MANTDWVERVTNVMKRSLRALHMTTPTTELDARFYQLCFDTSMSKGYISEGWMCITPYLETSVSIAQAGYRHLQSVETRVWIALWTAFLSALDDTHEQVPRDVIASFAHRMVSGQPQPYAYPGLECFAAHLRARAL